MSGVEILVAAVVGYLIGAIPSGVLVGRLRGVDPRASGSGRTGTTNALRSLGPRWAVAVAAMDVGKGILAVAIGAAVASSAWGGPLAGLAAVIGHVRSVFIGFGGGRGVATGGGAMLVLVPLGVLVALLEMGFIVWRTRLVSLGSLMAAVTVPLVAAALYAAGWIGIEPLVGAAAIGVVVVVAHADNIARLRAGTERRLGSG
ncbi:MAG TPA: glycerol-3-phosphate 1-O-acyltransferase PlsY [Candidatus Limnocylindria bacterium]|nr:glycerol-3-phosphate 1-O-acyltransferase PlsY [Candidatus Limnocylindria bacterium]HET9879171.1 glycerol-3-phosphate 1-O-acyltransferase PlsY [Candidatus Limnocylindria bacterium]